LAKISKNKHSHFYIFLLKNVGTSKSSHHQNHLSIAGLSAVLVILESVTGFLPNGLDFKLTLASGI
jgi:hypothetical protein